MTTREQIIAAAKEAGFPEWENTDDPEFLKVIEKLYVVAFQSGAASRDAEIQRLQFALADSEALELGTAERCDQLRAELAAALAACKVKDEALTSLTIHRESAISSEYEAAEEALAIQPDDAALKAWLGEPVSFLYKHNSSFGDGHFWTHRPTHNGVAALETKALYSPKELK